MEHVPGVPVKEYMTLPALACGEVGYRFCLFVIGVASFLCLSAPAGEAQLHFLSTNESSFFLSDHRTGATYYRFGAGGSYEEIAREHMGIFPFGSGTWRQDTNGVISIVSTNKHGKDRPQERVIPMAYKDQIFLVWPDKSWASNTMAVVQKIDAPEKKLHVYNAFKIPEAKYSNGTARPYPFQFYTNLNPPEATEAK